MCHDEFMLNTMTPLFKKIRFTNIVISELILVNGFLIVNHRYDFV